MSEIIKVAHSFPTWLPQTQTWMYTQVKHLPTSIESHIVCERTENLEQFYVPNIHHPRRDAGWSDLWNKRLRRLFLRRDTVHLSEVCKHLGVRIIHSHFGNVGWSDIRAARLANVKHVVTFYGFDVNMLPSHDPRWRHRYLHLFQSADLFLCEGPHMVTSLIDMGCPPGKAFIQHLGVELDRIPYKPRVWSPEKPLRVLISSSFNEKKGIPYALEALSKLKTSMKIEITIIGDASSEPEAQIEKKRIMDTIERCGLRQITRLLGFQTHARLWEEAYKHHLFISPSVTAKNGDTEGGAPVTLIEMAASGMPIVSTTHCDIPNVIEHGKSGFLAPEKDVDSLLGCIYSWLAVPDQWGRMLKAGRERVEVRFCAQKQGKKLAAIYAGMLE